MNHLTSACVRDRQLKIFQILDGFGEELFWMLSLFWLNPSNPPNTILNQLNKQNCVVQRKSLNSSLRPESYLPNYLNRGIWKNKGFLVESKSLSRIRYGEKMLTDVQFYNFLPQIFLPYFKIKTPVGKSNFHLKLSSIKLSLS